MRLWLLQARDDLTQTSGDPWGSGYDKRFGVAVRAESLIAARKLCHETEYDSTLKNTEVWLHPKYSTCEQIKEDGPEEVILEGGY